MDGFRTVGPEAAAGAVRAMLSGRGSHAVLLAGPASVGKRSLALDLAAGLLCTAEVGDRPCRECRACRMVEHGNHPDLHLLEPEGPGGQVGIGGKDGKRGVRDLVTELSLLPVEGVARVAIFSGSISLRRSQPIAAATSSDSRMIPMLTSLRPASLAIS